MDGWMDDRWFGIGSVPQTKSVAKQKIKVSMDKVIWMVKFYLKKRIPDWRQHKLCEAQVSKYIIWIVGILNNEGLWYNFYMEHSSKLHCFEYQRLSFQEKNLKIGQSNYFMQVTTWL